jgi:hypothetical protein
MNTDLPFVPKRHAGHQVAIDNANQRRPHSAGELVRHPVSAKLSNLKKISLLHH